MRERAMNGFLMSAVAVILASGAAYGHGGESHAEPEIAAVAPEGLVTELAQNEAVELALKHPPLEPGRESVWTLYLSDYETNAPIEDAAITLSIRGRKDSTAAAKPSSAAGVYAAKLLFPEKGAPAVTIRVVSEDLDELLVLAHVEVGGAPEASGPARRGPWEWGLAAALAVAFLAAFFFMRQKSRPLKAAGFLAAAFLWGSNAFAHGGQDHGEETFGGGASAVVGRSIRLSKESQFLLGVRTVFAQSRVLKKRIKTLGKVVPRREGRADIYPPQSGRIIAHEAHYRVPRIGDRVRAGQIVAELQTVSSFHIKAPISGVVTELNFAVGEQVDVSRKLMTILDPRVLWVEASIFEPDLRFVEDSREAVIASPAYPGESFRGKLVALSAVFDEATRSVKAVFEFINTRERLRPGMFVDVAIEAEAKEEALAVPRSAVLEKDGTRVVFVHVGVEEFEMREVRLGGRYGDLVAVKAGLAEDERVVTVGGYQLLTAPGRSKK